MAAYDTDMFKIDCEAGATLIVEVYFDEDDDIDIAIYDSAEDEISHSWYDNPEMVQTQPAADGYIYIEIYPYAVSAYWYEMVITYYPPLVDDDYDDDYGNDAAVNATALTAGNYTDLVCLDYDWYSMELNKGETINVVLEFNQSYCDLDIRIYFGEKLVSGALTHEDHETVSYDVKETGTYYIVVVPFHLGPENLEYDLSLTITDSPSSIPGFAPFFLALSIISTLGIILYKKRK